MQCLVPAEKEAQHSIEADKMIDMGVGYEDVGYFQNIPRVEGLGIADVEKNSPLFKRKRDEEPGIIKGAVDEPGME